MRRRRRTWINAAEESHYTAAGRRGGQKYNVVPRWRKNSTNRRDAFPLDPTYRMEKEGKQNTETLLCRF
ncbi:hypothetical protein PBY51_013836 [Eleginops maclovinus]|uniref:Uncharacterized protein n=1 Tax=Eleginops maclovinus TaxID=56733 RepID=A0AAN7Y955_ELEMC|nr:hypothetical protein PBY51_013836 [Eleginops maclovinus]